MWDIKPECIKIKNLPNNCLHWVSSNYNDKYNLYFDFQINDEFLDNQIGSYEDFETFEHLKHSTKLTTSCGNPWNLMTKAEANIIKETQPKRNKKPVCSDNDNDVNILFEKNMTFENTKNNITKLLSSDCWGMYTKSKKCDVPIYIYFDSRTHYRKIEKKYNLNELPIDEYKKIIYGTKNKDMRFKLMENLNDCLSECLINAINNNYVVCVILGGCPLYDYYYYPNNENNTFDCVTVQY